MFDDFEDERYADELCGVCGEPYQCNEFAHEAAETEPFLYDDEPVYDPWQDERYTFMTTGAPF